jgi:hypothetical protein
MRTSRIAHPLDIVTERRAVQLAATPAAAASAPRRMVRVYSSEGRRLAHDLSEGEVLRKEAAGKMDVRRKDGVIVSAKELPLMRKRIDGRMVPVRVAVDERASGLSRVRFTKIDREADERSLRWRVRHKRAA